MSALLFTKIAVTAAAGAGVLVTTDVYCLAVYAALVAILTGFVLPYAGFLGDAFMRGGRTLAAELAGGSAGRVAGEAGATPAS